MQTITVEQTHAMIRSGSFPDDTVQVEGEANFSGETTLTTLPAGLRQVWALDVSGCTALKSLPEGLQVHRLNVTDCTALKTLPSGLNAYSIQAQRAGLQQLPDDLRVSYKLDLTACTELRTLPAGLRVGSLVIRDCTALEALPDRMHLYFLDAANCIHLRAWGATGGVEVGNIDLSGCRQLTYLPDWMGTISQLNLRDCANLRHLPENLHVTSTLELAGSGITDVPEGCRDATLRWRGVTIDRRIAFQPETLTAQEIMQQPNIELRRVMLERMGYEAFFKQAKARELDRDVDPGGVRRLLRVDFQERNRSERDEPLVCLTVICPSTARHYIIRVPPGMKTCRQAAAWVAGFDNPDRYQPVCET